MSRSNVRMTDAEARGDDPSAGEECAVCANEIETDEWHPVATQTNPAETRIVSFCSEDCREQWLAERPELSTGER